MEINTLFQKINNLSESTLLEEVLIYENMIFKKIQDEENKILELSIEFQENIKYQIQKKQTQLDQLQVNYEDTILTYFKKEETYKFPTKLIEIQNLIQKTKESLSSTKQELMHQKKEKILLLNQLQQQELQFNKTLLVQDRIRFQCDMLVSFWEDTLETLEITSESKLTQVKASFNTSILGIQDKNKINVQQQLSHVLEELVSQFEKIETTQNLLLEEKRIVSKIIQDEFDSLQLQNIKIQLQMEYDIFEKKKIKLRESITQLQKEYKRNLQSENYVQAKFQRKLSRLYSQKKTKIDNFYQQLEVIMSHLKSVEHKLIYLQKSKSHLLDNLNHIEKTLEVKTHAKITLEKQLLKYNNRKEFMLPNIIQKYNFYMNFYHYDLKDTQIKMNVLRNNIKSLHKKDILDHPEISVSYQKINILKKLQVYINNKFYDVKT